MNAFKAALGSKPQFGLWQALANPYSAEICAGAGFDFLVFDGEHAPNSIPLILSQLQAVASYPVEPIVRIADSSRTLIKHHLDIGVRTLLVPMIESLAEAEHVVASTRYPPNGARGVGAGLARASRWGRVPEYLQKAEDDLCLLLQIESRAGLDALEGIAALDGVHGIFVGPADLAADMGHLGNSLHPDVDSAVEGAIRCIVSAGVAAGVMTLDEAAARRYAALGASFLAVATDTGILARGAEAAIARYR